MGRAQLKVIPIVEQGGGLPPRDAGQAPRAGVPAAREGYCSPPPTSPRVVTRGPGACILRAVYR